MLKIYTVRSKNSQVPLAEVRTDGRTLEFIVDNTNGQLPMLTNKNFSRLQQIVAQSSHLEMDEPTAATVRMLSYVLDNGDVAEITTDGKSCLLNGRLLSEQEKQALFQAIKRKEINVVNRADMANSTPVLPSAPAPKMSKPEAPHLDMQVLREIQALHRQEKEMDDENSSNHDNKIEGMDFQDQDNDAPAQSKALMYALKYGKFQGDDEDA